MTARYSFGFAQYIYRNLLVSESEIINPGLLKDKEKIEMQRSSLVLAELVLADEEEPMRQKKPNRGRPPS